MSGGAKHYSTDEGWFYVLEDGTEVGPFKTEWEMLKYVEDRDINEQQAPAEDRPEA